MLDAHVLQVAAAIEPRGLPAADWFVLANLIRDGVDQLPPGPIPYQSTLACLGLGGKAGFSG